MGYAKCAIRCCPSSSIRNKDLKFHHFPTDVESNEIWINACKRTDMFRRDSDFFKDKYICSLHFDKSMYKQKILIKSAFPSLYLPDLPLQIDSHTQTWESIQFFRPKLELKETDTDGVYVLPDIKKVEVRTSYTQTEDITEKGTEQETERHELISQIFIKDYNMLCDKPKTETNDRTDAHTLRAPTKESRKYVDTETEKKKEDDTKTSFDSANTLYENKQMEKSVQTNNVVIYLVPNKLEHYYQQCVKCGNRQKVDKNGEPVISEDLIKEEFLKACDKFLSPVFSTCVKNQIVLEELLNDANNSSIPSAKRQRLIGYSYRR